MAIPMIGLSKKEVRVFCNEVDTISNEINLLCQAALDKTGVKIDSELASCGRELTSATKTANDIKPILERVINQLPVGTPPEIRLFLESAMSEINNKVETIVDNMNMVQTNIKDVDVLTDEMDKITDQISVKIKEIDVATNKYQV